MGWVVDTGEGLGGMGQPWTAEYCAGALGRGLGSPCDKGLLVPPPPSCTPPDLGTSALLSGTSALVLLGVNLITRLLSQGRRHLGAGFALCCWGQQPHVVASQ